MGREGTPPRDAATLLVVRQGRRGLEIFCVERNKKSRFLGGALVFPGGKLDEGDRCDAWTARTTEPRASRDTFAPDVATLRALAVAGCRESLEEAAILPVVGGSLSHADLLALRAAVCDQRE